LRNNRRYFSETVFVILSESFFETMQRSIFTRWIYVAALFGGYLFPLILCLAARRANVPERKRRTCRATDGMATLHENGD
jgi:hypothetical protein